MGTVIRAAPFNSTDASYCSFTILATPHPVNPLIKPAKGRLLGWMLNTTYVAMPIMRPMVKLFAVIVFTLVSIRGESLLGMAIRAAPYKELYFLRIVTLLSLGQERPPHPYTFKPSGFVKRYPMVSSRL